MKTVKINLYNFNELSENAKEKAISEHMDFLNSMPVPVENENSELIDEYFDHSEEDTIDHIEANEYIFFANGEIAPCTTYVGKHSKAGITELKFKGEIYTV